MYQPCCERFLGLEIVAILLEPPHPQGAPSAPVFLTVGYAMSERVNGVPDTPLHVLNSQGSNVEYVV